MTPAREALRQRADYTHRFNTVTGRHGWLRLTPAYSVKIVEELLGGITGRRRVLDPFCGTATTALCAARHGHDAVTTDVNPFLVWFGRTKTAHHRPETIAAARQAGHEALRLVARDAVELAAAPPIHRIERWWSPDTLRFLRGLRAAIEATAPEGGQERDLLHVAFCRTLIALSSAAFDHQSMSFRNGGPPAGADPARRFAGDVRSVLHGAEDNPAGRAAVILGDARDLPAAVREPVDLVITSPPYANRMSYVRELRPYMYWLGFLASGRDAGELDWSAIGGTWGIATSRLTDWTRDGHRFDDPELDAAVARIAAHDARSGPLLATYVTKYADDAGGTSRACAACSPPAPPYTTWWGTRPSTASCSRSSASTRRCWSASVYRDRVPSRPEAQLEEGAVEFDVTARWR